MTKLKNIKAPSEAHSRLIWPKNLSPFAFQLDGCHFCIERFKNFRAAYIAADPGCGKTIIAAILQSWFRSQGLKKIVYISPPGLVSNVIAEFAKWGTLKGLIVLSDSALLDVTIQKFDVLIIDEAHRFKNEQTNRGSALFRLEQMAKYVVLMSGTPMPNARPIELWPFLHRYASEEFGDKRFFWKFAKKFCGLFQDQFGNWNYSGYTNKKLFEQTLYKSFMLRIKKEDVLDLPPKREGLLTLGDSMPPTIRKLEKKVLEEYGEKDLIAGKIHAKAGKSSLHLSEYLRLLGEYKLKFFFPFLEHLIYETKEKVLIFTKHRKVAEDLQTFLTKLKPIVITGDTPKKQRPLEVKRFQEDPKTRFGILNIEAGGLGWTLTEADRIIMLEQSWRDGDNKQASDRASRIGSKKPLLVQYVVLANSFDARRMNVILNKRQNAV